MTHQSLTVIIRLEKGKMKDLVNDKNKDIEEEIITPLQCKKGCEMVSLENFLRLANVSSITQGYDGLPVVDMVEGYHNVVQHEDPDKIDSVGPIANSIARENIAKAVREGREIEPPKREKLN